jgi:alkylhydroperoxidase family enzyme
MLDALRNGELVPDDPKRRSLQVLTQELIERRGWLTSETRAAALEAGYDEGAIMEVVMLVAIKTLTNYAHHAADVPLDDSMKHPPIRWNPPAEE